MQGAEQINAKVIVYYRHCVLIRTDRSSLMRNEIAEHRYFVSAPNLSVDSERILDFYHVARFDGLSKFEMDPNYLTQHFVDRDDFLYYR